MSFYDVMFHLDSNDPAMLRLVLKNANNYLNALPDEKFQLHVVVNGPGVKLFTNDQQDLKDLAHPVAMRGVKFKLCANAVQEHNINPQNIWDWCEIVPAGLVEVVRLQRDGFAYIKP